MADTYIVWIVITIHNNIILIHNIFFILFLGIQDNRGALHRLEGYKITGKDIATDGIRWRNTTTLNRYSFSSVLIHIHLLTVTLIHMYVSVSIWMAYIWHNVPHGPLSRWGCWWAPHCRGCCLPTQRASSGCGPQSPSAGSCLCWSSRSAGSSVPPTRVSPDSRHRCKDESRPHQGSYLHSNIKKFVSVADQTHDIAARTFTASASLMSPFSQHKVCVSSRPIRPTSDRWWYSKGWWQNGAPEVTENYKSVPPVINVFDRPVLWQKSLI